MNTPTIRTMMTLAMIALLGVVPMCAEQPEANQRVQLTDMAGAKRSTLSAALDMIEARVEFANVQPAAAGLTLTVVLVNRGAEAVRILDPEDFTSVLLLDENGWPLEVPRSIPKVLDDRGHRPGEPLHNAGPESVTLAPDQEYRLVIRIKDVLRAGKEGEPYKPQPITGGKYSAKVTTTLVTPVPEGTAPSRVVSTPEAFTLNLGV
jgi:hypothetical protein